MAGDGICGVGRTRWIRIVTICVLAAVLITGCTTSDHPAGWKAVDYRGERIYVPSKLPIDARASLADECKLFATRSPSIVVEVQAAEPNTTHLPCAPGSRVPPGPGTVVVLSQTTDPPRTPPDPSLRPLTIHGIAGFTYGPRPYGAGGGYFGVFVSRRTGVILAVAAPDARQVQTILANIRAAPA